MLERHRAGKSPGENAVCIQSAVTSPPPTDRVEAIIRDVIYREREIRCNESRCYGRIKASGKLIRECTPIEYRMCFADELPFETQSKDPTRSCGRIHTASNAMYALYVK